MPIVVGFLLTLVCCAIIGVITEFVAVRPVLKSLDQHLYVLSTLALALMIQQVTAIEWSTEPQPFPRLFGIGSGGLGRKILAAGGGLRDHHHRRSNISIAARWSAAPSWRSPRIISPPARSACRSAICASPATRWPASIGGVAGFSGGELLLAFFANGALLNFYGFVPVALGGLGNNRGAIIGGLALGLFQQAANFLVGGIFSSVAVFTLFIVVLLAAPQGLFGAPTARRV